MSNGNTEENKNPQDTQPKPKMRQVILETNGTDIRISKNETAGNLEFIALLSTILNKLQQP